MAAAKRAILALPLSPYAVWSSVRYRGWFGPCWTVRNPRTGQTKDIGFRNNVVNMEAVRAFLGDADLTVADTLGYVTKRWDQSGNGRHLLQATAGNQPAIGARHHVKGVVPVSFDGTPDSALKNPKWMEATGLSLSSRSFTVLQWSAVVSAHNQGTLWDFMDAANASRMTLYAAGGSIANPSSRGFFTFDAATIGGFQGILKSEGCMVGVTSSGTQLIHYLDTVAGTPAAAAANNTLTQFRIGRNAGTDAYGCFDDFCTVVWNVALSAAEVEIARKQMAAAFSRGKPVAQIVFSGNSDLTGYGGTGCNAVIPMLLNMFPEPVAILNNSIWGTTAQIALANYSALTGQADTTMQQRTLVAAQGVNDIAGGRTGTQAYNDNLAIINAAKAEGTYTKFGMIGFFDIDPADPNQAQKIIFNNLGKAAVGTDLDFYIYDVNYDGRWLPGDFTDNHANSSGQTKYAQNYARQLARACGF